MRLFIDSKPIANFSGRRMREVNTKAPREAAETVVIDLDAADARIEQAGRMFYGGVGLLAAILIGGVVIGFLLGSDRSDAALVLPVALITAIGCIFVLRWASRRSLNHWRGERAARAAASPSPGTQLRADADGLAISGALAQWSALHIQAIYFNRVSNGEDTAYRLERFVLSAGAKLVTFDRDLLSEGDPILQWIYTKLIVERGLKELSGETA